MQISNFISRFPRFIRYFSKAIQDTFDEFKIGANW